MQDTVSGGTAASSPAWIGRPLKRREDRRHLLGRGRFVADLAPPGCLHAAFLRSPVAKGRIAALDVAAAAQRPGVAAILTGADLAHVPTLSVNPLLPGIRVPPTPILAREAVRYLGEPIALIVAQSVEAALDALEAIDLDIESEAARVDPAGDDDPVMRQSWRHGDYAAARAGAATIVSVTVRQARIAAMPLEGRAILAAYDPGPEELTIWLSTQGPWRARSEFAALLGLPEARLRVIAPDVGGAFGLKASIFREDVAVAMAALRLARPVKWIATRAEDLASAQHARGGASTGELAVAADGTILGLKADIACPLGGALCFSAAVTPSNHARVLPGPYAVPAAAITTAGFLTNTAPVGIYRGAGRPEATMLMERLADRAAAALGLDPAEFRHRNLLPPESLPFRSATGQLYDSGDFPDLLGKALAAFGYVDQRRRQAERRRAGEWVGLGLCHYVEPCGQGWESATIRIERDGGVTVLSGATAQGQGRETAAAQIVADALGVDPAAITVRAGDTLAAPPGLGAYASRATAIGGSALLQAASQVRAQAMRLAAEWLKADPQDIVVGADGFAAGNRRLHWAEIAAAAYRHKAAGNLAPPGLEATAFYEAKGEAWSSGCCAAAVSIDPATGVLTVEKLAWADDAGVVVNPLLAEGQLLGGLAQGYGQAVLERIVYDSEGQLLSGSLMDYGLPRAADVPAVAIVKAGVRSPHNLIGAKGVGEAGCIAIPPALVNAAVDALAPLGVQHLDMPMTPEVLWRAIRDARKNGADR